LTYEDILDWLEDDYDWEDWDDLEELYNDVSDNWHRDFPMSLDKFVDLFDTDSPRSEFISVGADVTNRRLESLISWLEDL
jgi:hypothetical protein